MNDSKIDQLLFAMEREEILKHKWCMSEKAGHDVGFLAALTDWTENHAAKWRNKAKAHISAEFPPKEEE